MRAVVVYESHWGNTAAVARAIAEGLGPQAQAMNTDEAVGSAVAGAELVVVGAPVIAFALPREGTRKVAKAERFIVAGAYGPLRDGELERARRWGAALADAVAAKR